MKIFVHTLVFRAQLQGLDISLLAPTLESYLFKNWFRVQEKPNILLTASEVLQLVKNKQEEELLRVAVSLLSLKKKSLELLFPFLEQIISLNNKLPSLAKEAILTGNPFLFRSLFLNFKEAQELAVGGKGLAKK